MKHLIIKSHQPSFDYHLDIKKGEVLQFERKPSDIAGWIWCTTMEGKMCWAPEAWVKIMGKECKMLQNYSSKELLVEVGDMIDLHLRESGWAWVKNNQGQFGWIPLACIS